MFGLGLTILVGQLPKILGIPGVHGSFVEEATQLAQGLGEIDVPTLVLGVLALVALILGHRYAPTLPMALIVVVAGIVAVAVLGLEARGVEVIGAVSGGLPVPAVPLIGAHDLLALVPGAIAIAIIGCAESLTVAQQFADEHRDEIRPDQELVANGGANLLAGLFQGFIVGGGASQSAANDRAGATTPLASLIVAGLTVVTMVALLPLFHDLPQAVLGAIVISAVIGFLRIDELARIRRLRPEGFVMALVALVATLLLGILPGLIVAVVLSLLLLLVRLARPTATPIGRRPGGAWASMTAWPDAEAVPGLIVLRLDAPLLFLNAALLRDEVRAAIRDGGRASRHRPRRARGIIGPGCREPRHRRPAGGSGSRGGRGIVAGRDPAERASDVRPGRGGAGDRVAPLVPDRRRGARGIRSTRGGDG